MLLLVDLDGVVYRGGEAVPGIPELLRKRASHGDTVVYVTNNSRLHRSDYLSRLTALGAPVSPGRVVTAARATALLLADGERPRCVMVFGGPGLARELRDVGLRTVPPTATGRRQEPDVVVTGVDFSLSYQRLSLAADAVRAGARFIATNRDAIFPGAEGFTAGAGAIVAALEVASGRSPDLVVGKPEPRLFRTAAEAVGERPEHAVVIGDNLGTDIRAAHAVGARSILMLTGVTTADALAAYDGPARPTAVARDAGELARILERFSSDTPFV